MDSLAPQTKKCPYCGETIQAQAIKCRFCAEFLRDDPLAASGSLPPDETPNPKAKILFRAQPSLWGMAGTFVVSFVLLVLAGFILFPSVQGIIDQMAQWGWNTQWFDQPQNQTLIRSVKTIIGLGLVVSVLFVLLVRMAKIMSTVYEVTPDRIEWARGIFNRKIDNLDLFRIVDLRLHRSLSDCLLGIGALVLLTNDQSDPEFTFQKIKHPRRLYDILKAASLDADQHRNVVHLD